MQKKEKERKKEEKLQLREQDKCIFWFQRNDMAKIQFHVSKS